MQKTRQAREQRIMPNTEGYRTCVTEAIKAQKGTTKPRESRRFPGGAISHHDLEGQAEEGGRTVQAERLQRVRGPREWLAHGVLGRGTSWRGAAGARLWMGSMVRCNF